MKSITTRQVHHVNWLVKVNAEECRKLVKHQKIVIFTGQIRVLNYIRIPRCTNCQALDHHRTSQCDWISECAKCSGEHQTDFCKRMDFSCVNCTHAGIKNANHTAFSPGCQVYQNIKKQKLQDYYKGRYFFKSNTSSKISKKLSTKNSDLTVKNTGKKNKCQTI